MTAIAQPIQLLDEPDETLHQAGGDADAARQRSQKVDMPRSEIELYVREGRPTGLLLSSVAILKGLSVTAVAQASGIPERLVQALFSEQGVNSVKRGAIKKVAGVLGIDLSTMRFAAGQVHVFKLGNISFFTGLTRGKRIMRAAGLLARGARVAELRTGTRPALRRIFVAQNEHFRALFVSGRLSFDLAAIPSAQWVRGQHQQSVVSVRNTELVKHLQADDLTEGEFDELFLGPNAVTWEDIRVASRVNGVSKQELLAFIQSRAEQIDATDEQEEKRAVNEALPFLRLVESDMAVANG
jgi:hypothetical protein